jgi:tetratricopeptide (TPR) repeat protein
MLFLTLLEQNVNVILHNLMNTPAKICLYKLLLSLICLLQFNQIASANAESENLFHTGLNHYEQEKYNEAIKQLEVAVQIEPQVAEYHHILAKSYGKEAERTNWFRAMSLAKKTLVHLELAAQLDSRNVDILDDLMDYYREAPEFLGGDTKKADKIEHLIEKINAKEP